MARHTPSKTGLRFLLWRKPKTCACRCRALHPRARCSLAADVSFAASAELACLKVISAVGGCGTRADALRQSSPFSSRVITFLTALPRRALLRMTHPAALLRAHRSHCTGKRRLWVPRANGIVFYLCALVFFFFREFGTQVLYFPWSSTQGSYFVGIRQTRKRYVAFWGL